MFYAVIVCWVLKNMENISLIKMQLTDILHHTVEASYIVKISLGKIYSQKIAAANSFTDFEQHND